MVYNLSTKCFPKYNFSHRICLGPPFVLDTLAPKTVSSLPARRPCRESELRDGDATKREAPFRLSLDECENFSPEVVPRCSFSEDLLRDRVRLRDLSRELRCSLEETRSLELSRSLELKVRSLEDLLRPCDIPLAGGRIAGAEEGRMTGAEEGCGRDTGEGVGLGSKKGDAAGVDGWDSRLRCDTGTS